MKVSMLLEKIEEILTSRICDLSHVSQVLVIGEVNLLLEHRTC